MTLLSDRLLDVIESSPQHKASLEPLMQDMLNFDLTTAILTTLASVLDAVGQGELPIDVIDEKFDQFSRLVVVVHHVVSERGIQLDATDPCGFSLPYRVLGSGEWVPVALYFINLRFQSLQMGESADWDLNAKDGLQVFEFQSQLFNILIRVMDFAESEVSFPKGGIQGILASGRGQQLLSQATNGYDTCAKVLKGIQNPVERVETVCGEIFCHAARIRVACYAAEQAMISNNSRPNLTEVTLALADFSSSWLKLVRDIDVLSRTQFESVAVEWCMLSSAISKLLTKVTNFLGQNCIHASRTEVMRDEICALFMALEGLCTLASTMPTFLPLFEVWKDIMPALRLPWVFATTVAKILAEISYSINLQGKRFQENFKWSPNDFDQIYTCACDAFDAAVRLGFIFAEMDLQQLEMLRKYHVPEGSTTNFILTAIGRLEIAATIAEIMVLLLVHGGFAFAPIIESQLQSAEVGSAEASHTHGLQAGCASDELNFLPQYLRAKGRADEEMARALSLLRLIGTMQVPFEITSQSMEWPGINGIIMYFATLSETLAPCLISRDGQGLRRLIRESKKVVGADS